VTGATLAYGAGLAVAIGSVVLAVGIRRATVAGIVGAPGRRAGLRTLYTVVALALLAIGAYELLIGSRSFGWNATPAVDFQTYRDATVRLLEGKGWFLDRQVHGPYELWLGDILYPPLAAVLWIPFLLLPAALFWIIPGIVIAAVVASWRPATWAFPLIALCLAWPLTLARVITGNPMMWLAAFTALGLRWGWPAALVFVKPTVAPFALIGANRRSWWVATGLMLVALIVADGALWIRVLLDTQVTEGWLYGYVDAPGLALPVVAWLGRTTERSPVSVASSDHVPDRLRDR
jgi:hypothetical protein